jgi:hypothetical protein
VRSILRVQELRRRPQCVACSLNTALQNVAGTQFLVELANINSLALVPEGGVAGDAEEILEPGERGYVGGTTGRGYV